MDAELERLKGLPLDTYATSLGYFRDRSKSTRQVAVLRREDGDKLLVTVGHDGHGIYRSERNHADRGTILDLAMTRLQVNLGGARKALRAWANLAPLPSCPSFSPVSASTEEPDRHRMTGIWNASRRAAEHPYLLSRHVPLATLNDPRFADCWRLDRHGNAVFPYRDDGGIAALEFRGDGQKRLAAGSRKTAWASRNVATCARLVVCESPIDCLAHHALHMDASDAVWPLGYIAFGGGLSNRQHDLLALLFAEARDRGAEIVIGTDNDDAGDAYAETLGRLAAPAHTTRTRPIGKDFADDLAYCAIESGFFETPTCKESQIERQTL